MYSFGAFRKLSRTALHPELERHLTGSVLDHPLVHFEYVDPRIYSRLNQLFEHRQRIRNCPDKLMNDWERLCPERPPLERYLWFIESLFQEQFSDLLGNPDEYHRMIGQIWTDPEILANNSDGLAIIFNRPLPSEPVESFMTESELRTLAELPEELQVFRGHVPVLEHRASWTLSPTVALDWACRAEPCGADAEWKIDPQEYQFNAPVVTMGTVQKSEIIAFVDRRNEDEILVRTEYVLNRQSFDVIRETA